MASERVAASDGWQARSQRTRHAVVTALLALLHDGNLRPTAKEIAERAGVSLRSVYVHFDDVDDLFVAAAAEQVTTISQIVRKLPSDGPLDDRLDQFADQRAAVWEALGGVGRAAALHEPFSAALSRLLRDGRATARAEVATVFAAEIAGDELRLCAADLVTSTDAWRQLRVHQGLDADTAKRVMRDTLASVLRARRGDER